jgi:arylsulfatase A-like enzyme
VYGYDRNTSANLDSLARESVVYTEAIATSSWTLPAHASLFSGKYAASHGARYDSEGALMLTSAIKGPESWNEYRASGMDPNTATLAEVLGEAGYETGAVVGGPWMKTVFGLDRGFETYDDDDISTVTGRLARDVTDRALAWIKKNRRRPQFLFLNYYDPHTPFSPPSEFTYRHVTQALMSDPDQADLRDRRLYDAEIDYMDHHIGRLCDGLREMGLYEKTWIIVTADHGELLGEDGKWGHGHYLTEEELRIPLIVKYPWGEVAPRRDSSRVSLVDVLPIVLARLGIEPPADIQGSTDLRHPMIAEVYPLPSRSPDGRWLALYEGRYKFLWNSLGRHALYDVANDATEDSNLLDELPERAGTMSKRLGQYLESLPRTAAAGDTVLVDEETQEMLRSLGYTN